MNSILETMKDRTTFVTIPFLPPFEEYTETLRSVWDNQWLTNGGPLLKQFESELSEFCGVTNLRVVANGTLALQIAFRALGISGEVLTTPFTYIATSSSLLWQGCEPRFADIDPNSFNLDPQSVRHAISPKTRAIVATHVFGNPCAVDELQVLAREYGIPLIFDAAHAIGVIHRGRSLLSYGDISTLSLHATKFIHSVEGGAIHTSNPELFRKVSYMRGFGHNGPDKFHGIGINAKMSEFHATMGIVNLRHTKDLITRRRRQCAIYREILQECASIQFQKVAPDTIMNESCLPILLPSEQIVIELLAALASYNVHPRRYFHPSLNTLSALNLTGHCPIAEDIASRILCVPLAHQYEDLHIKGIAEAIRDFVSTKMAT